MKYLMFTLFSLLAACGSNDPGTIAINHIPDHGVTAPSPGPVPSVSPSPVPSCKPLASSWSTLQTPPNATLGIYIGPPTNGPIYVLDLSWATTGASLAVFNKDATHSCSYAATLGTATYRLDSFNGCNPGVIPPGGTVNDQCNYCPYNGPASSVLNISYDYVLTCHALSIHDTFTGQTVAYY